jgi:hypothetical protein
MTIADAMGLAGVFERLADPQQVPAAFVLTPCTYYLHRRIMALSSRLSRIMHAVVPKGTA